MDHRAGLMSASMLALLSSWIAYRLGFYQFPSKNQPIQEKIHFFELLGAFFIFLFAALFLLPLIALLLISWKAGRLVNTQEEQIDLVTYSQLNIIAVLLTATSIGAFTCLISPRARQAILRKGTFLGLQSNAWNVGIGCCAWLVSYPCVLVIAQAVYLLESWLGLPRDQHEQVAVRFLRMAHGHPVLFIISSLLIIFIVPVVEEILFRGFLQTWLRQKMSMMKAMILSSIIFALFHYSASQGTNNIELLMSLFVLSCFLGFLYERQQSIVASIALHTIFNAISVVMILFQ